MEPDGHRFTQLNQANGLGSSKVIDFAIDDNQLWLTHAKGVQHLRLAALHQEVPIPAISIRQVTVNDSVLQEIGSLGTFDHTQRKFRFQVSTPTLRYRANIVYHYRLLGYEDAWTTAPYRDHEFTYNALGPGQYTFQVKAENQGKISQAATYSFSISAPLYARWWFIVVVALLILALISLIYLRQLRVQRRKASLLNELNVSRLTAIQSQMNPHFIFNALNSIQNYIMRNDKDLAMDYLGRFARLIRHYLNASTVDLVTLEDEISMLENYLRLEQMRYSPSFEFHFDIEKTIDTTSVKLPPLLIQPFVENAIWHGLQKKERAGKLTIAIILQGSELICTIEDDGGGMEKAKPLSNRKSSGIQITKERLNLIHALLKTSSRFIIEDVKDENGHIEGTRVRFNMPYVIGED